MSISKTAFLFLLIISIFISGLPLLSIDQYFRFTEQTLPESVQFEKKRKLCLFNFRNTKEDPKLDYLSKGVPSVILSGFKDMKLIFDEDVLIESINYPYGNPAVVKEKKTRQRFDRNTIKELSAGALELLPEKDPRYIKLEVALKEESIPPYLELALGLGRKNKCYYVVTGEFNSPGDDRLAIKSEITFLRDGKNVFISTETSIKRGYQEMGDFVRKIKRSLMKRDPAVVKIDTGEEKDALVFIDGVYIGKSPIDKAEIPDGKHEFYVTKDGFQTEKKTFETFPDRKNDIKFNLSKKEKKGKISVVSEPSGAEVYHGLTYLGDTPLRDIAVPTGSNRIRISKEGYIDHYQGVEITESETANINLKLRVGDTETFYKNKKYVYLDYTYNEFSTFSLYSFLFFYAGFIYANIQADRLHDRQKSKYTYASMLTFVNQRTDITNETKVGLYIYESQGINDLNRKINYYHTYGNNALFTHPRFNSIRNMGGWFAAAAFSMLASSVIFFYL
ncbi:MAG: PEGA domain-containing protein, partial [Leptospira sp.]|nr:PEGA domain-containing protein [Leptospira sp.]